MAKNSRRRSGDRVDGRRIKSYGELQNLLPHYISRRSEAQKRCEHRFEVSHAAAWLGAQRKAGHSGMSFMHLFIAAFVRCCALLPGINRFIAGRRLYAHNNVEIILTIKRRHAVDDGEVPIKLVLDRSDTVFDVYRKLNRAIENAETAEGGTRLEKLAARLSSNQRILSRFISWLVKVIDYFGLLSEQMLAASPFHGSMNLSDNGSLGLDSAYCDLHDFGTVPISANLGRLHKTAEHSFIDIKFVLDGRIADMECFASMFAMMQELLSDPAQLELPPQKIANDDY